MEADSERASLTVESALSYALTLALSAAAEQLFSVGPPPPQRGSIIIININIIIVNRARAARSI